MNKTNNVINKLQYISQEANGKSHLEAIEMACACGLKWLQLRLKNTSYENALEIAQKAQEICAFWEADLIINDYPEIANRVGAKGVHLGKEDMSPKEARKILGNDKVIGATANTFEDVLNVYQDVDYIGVGPFRFTKTKKNLSPILGLKGYTEIINEMKKEAIQTPIIAIGGIEIDDISQIIKTGVHGIAFSSLFHKATNKINLVEELEAKLQ